MNDPHDKQKPASTERPQARTGQQIRQITEEIKKNEGADFTGLQDTGAQAHRLEARERSQRDWRSRDKPEREPEQELEYLEVENVEEENNNPVLQDLHARIQKNLDEMSFDDSEQWNSLQAMETFCANMFNNISTQEIKGGLDVRAVKLAKTWNDGILEMEKLEKYFTDQLSNCVRPNGDYNSDEAKWVHQLAVLKTMLIRLTLSIRRTVIALSHKDITEVSFGIFRSGALGDRINELLAQPGMEEAGIQDMKKVTREIARIMKGVCNWEVPIDAD